MRTNRTPAAREHGVSRRRLLGLAALTGLAPLLRLPPADAQSAATPSTRGTARVQGFSDPELDFQLMRVVGVISYGGAGGGEAFVTAHAIDPSSPQSWVHNWAQIGRAIDERGRTAAVAASWQTARECYLRAATYYRSAEYYADIRTDDYRSSGEASRHSFEAAARLSRPRIRPVRIPYDDIFLSGYYVRGAGDAASRPLVLIMSGYDGTSEEMYFESGAAAARRGFDALLFDGPGQMGLRRFFPDVPFRPDYEAPIRAVVDFALQIPGVDPDRLALFGVSFGGYLAARGAAGDDRIQALILDSPVTDFGAWFKAENPALYELPRALTADMVDEADSVSPWTKQQFRCALARFGVSTLGGFLDALTEYQLGSAIQDITCPSLGMVSESEGPEANSQARDFVATVPGPSTLEVFTAAQGADSHCQFSNLPLANAVLYDWLAATFSPGG